MTAADPRAWLAQIKDRADDAAEQWQGGRGTFNANHHAPPIDAALVDGVDMAAALTAVLDALDNLEKRNIQNSLTLGEIDPGTTAYSDGHLVGIHKGRMEATARIHEAITDQWPPR